MLAHKSKSEQQVQHIFNNKFTENKPIPFPTHQKKHAYSNLFYWAHLVAHETGEFPLHGHEGFEIMTFVLKGSLEHFDTATKVWTPIKEGGFQVIQAGSGIMHAERITKGSELFQIWFDPDFSKSLNSKPGYQDYIKNDVLSYQKDGVETFEYIGSKSTTFHQTSEISITREFLTKGEHTKTVDISSTYSIYIISGEGSINEQVVTKDDFLCIEDTSSITLSTTDKLDIFIIQSPKVLTYKRSRE